MWQLTVHAPTACHMACNLTIFYIKPLSRLHEAVGHAGVLLRPPLPAELLVHVARLQQHTVYGVGMVGMVGSSLEMKRARRMARHSRVLPWPHPKHSGAAQSGVGQPSSAAPVCTN